jgi:hypothetical protein
VEPLPEGLVVTVSSSTDIDRTGATFQNSLVGRGIHAVLEPRLTASCAPGW